MKATLSHALAVLALAAALPCAALAQQKADVQIDAATRTAVIDELVTRLNNHYVFPEMAKKLEARLRKDQKAGKYDGITSGRQFADAITATLRETAGDRHLGVHFSAEPIPVLTDAEMRGEDPVRDAQFAAQVRRVNFGVPKVERMAGNIGYIKVDFFPPERHAAETYAAAMTFLAGTDALVIDLRENHGGQPAAVALLESYFFDRATHMNSIYYREDGTTRQYWTTPAAQGRSYGQQKPVYILTSRQTFSGGEDMAYSMQAQKRGTVIGETTGGGANPGAGYRLHPHFNAFISMGSAKNPVTGTNWERVGVKPDVAVAADDALRQARILALKPMVDKASDPDEREQLEELLKKETAVN